MTKPFSFTYSKLKSFETCGRQHKAQLDKLPGMEPSGDAIDYGNQVHMALHAALKDDTPLPKRLSFLQYWVDWVKSLPGERFVEEKWGLDKYFNEIAFFTDLAWLRLIVDVAVVNHDAGVAWLIDWKTGKRLEEPLQLWLGAALMFQKFPELQVIDSMFVWLKEDDGKNSHECISTETIKRSQIDDLWTQLIPRIKVYEDALATGAFYPSPGRHCRWCKVVDCKERAA
jgi:hypothetical protein